MARLATWGPVVGRGGTTVALCGDGGDWGTLGLGLYTSAPTFNTATPLVTGGMYGSWANPGGYLNYAGAVFVQNRRLYGRFYFRKSGNPNTEGYLANMYANAGYRWYLYLKTNGTLEVRDNAQTVIGSASSALSNATWYRIEFDFMIPSSGTTTTSAAVFTGNDTSPLSTMCSNATINTGTSVSTPAFSLGCPVSPTPATFDFCDLAVNDDTGSVNNGNPGIGHTTLLLPTADSAVGGGWKRGGGTTTNLWDAVNNIPPIGAASTGTDASQIGDAVSETASYDATLQTYTAKGILDTTPAVVQGLIRIGTSATTGSNNGTMQAISNPGLGGTTAISFEGSGANAGADSTPAGWTTERTLVMEEQTVTLGTAPVFRVTKTTAATRNHMVDLMGYIVDYDPTITAAQHKDITYATEKDTARPLLIPGREHDTAQIIDKDKHKSLINTAGTDTAQALVHHKIKTLTSAIENDKAEKLSIFRQAYETDIAQILDFALAVPQILDITYVTEINSSQSLTKIKFASISSATQIDAAQSIDRDKVVSHAAAAETDSAQALSINKQKALTPAAESSAVQSLDKDKLLSVDSGGEIDIAQTLSVGAAISRRALVSWVEFEIPQAVTGVQTITNATETDSAIALTFAKSINSATETDSATGLSHTRVISVVPNIETDSAQTLSITKTIYKTLTAAAESDLSGILTTGLFKSIYFAAETDTALALRVKQLVASLETDNAIALDTEKQHTISVTTETDNAQTLSATKVIYKTVETVTETDIATALSVTKTKFTALTVTTETDSALILAYHGFDVIYPAAEIDTARTLKIPKLLRATETNTAQTLTRFSQGSVNATTEIDSAQALAVVKPIYKTLTAATETGAAQTLSHTKSIQKSIVAVTETTAAQGLAKSKQKTLTQATETEIAGSLKVPRLTFAVELNTAIAPTISEQHGMTLGVVTESSNALILTFKKESVVIPAADHSASHTLTQYKFSGVSPATEIDSSHILSAFRSNSIAPVVEVNDARALAYSITKSIVAATETNYALLVLVSGYLLLGVAQETDQARPIIGYETWPEHPESPNAFSSRKGNFRSRPRDALSIVRGNGNIKSRPHNTLAKTSKKDIIS